MPRKPSDKITDLDTFSRLLQARGMKATAQRLAVHAAMMRLVHGSADTVYESIVAAGETAVTRASVYNILEDMASKGLYGRRLSAGSKMFFDIDPGRHVHLYDSRNHEFIDIEAPAMLEAVENGLRRRRFKGYKVDDVDVQIICHPTRKRRI